MGGEWGVGASLTMETIPPKTRGMISGLLQAGYPSGYLLAAVLYGTSYHFLGWRGMFMVGALQLGNLFASKNGTIQTTLAVSLGNNYGLALAITAVIVASAVAIITALGKEALGIKFGEEP